MKLEKFIVDFPEEAIADLHRRLDAVRWAQTGFDPGWEMGADYATLRDLVGYWRHQYDWFSIQDQLNRLDHHVTVIDGDRLHWVSYGATEKGAPPLLLLHGWPGSFVEFLDAAEMVCSSGYQVIVPSLPGFGFSDPPRRRGVHYGVMAERLHQLMTGLGHHRYGIEGGDWGSVIAMAMANRQPDSVVGIHITLIPGSLPPPEGIEPDPDEKEWREERERFAKFGFGYYDVQASRPDALTYGLTDSPLGLLTWLLEKFWAWGGHHGDLRAVFDRNRFLTNVMLYWLPNRILSSTRIYFETEAADEPPRGGYVATPTAYLRMPDEPWAPPRVVAERLVNVVHYTEAPRGGHFAAMEQPEIWADDVVSFFGSLGRDASKA